MTFRVTILGSSSALPTLKRNPSAHVLNVHEQFFLIDCGEGTQLRLRQADINPLKINAVFITHLHGDHLFGIFGLISSMGLMGRKTPLYIYAPKPFDEVLKCHLHYFDTNLPYEVIWMEVQSRKYQMIYENKIMEVWSIPLRHRIPCAGFLFKEKTPPLNVSKEAIEKYSLGIAQCAAAKRGEDIVLDSGIVVPNSELTYIPYEGRSYAYCSDTQYSAKVAELVKGVDLLYHEATFADKDKSLAAETGHSTSLQAAKIALKAEAGKLLLGHFSSRYKDDSLLRDEACRIFPNTEIAEELKSYEIKRLKYSQK